ncbi:MAG: diacylglycerol kinase family lipid kinase [Chloroflexi bacterium]|nr:diacylglycerol kinase family lipid kinase [Chloroflexota bacterium]
MPRKAKLILNPMADMGRAWTAARDLRPIVTEYGNADWSGTVYPGHATELARQAGEQGYDLVVALGGDGTVHEVVNGLMQVPEEKRPELGVVPIGSGNDFAHALSLPDSPNQALALALHREASPIDLGLLTDENGRQEYVDNTIGIGFDAVVTIRSHRLPVVRGFLMYLTAVIQTIMLNFDPAQLHIETDQESWDLSTLMLALCNGPREGGGFQVAPEARVDDGLLHYTTIQKVSRPMMFRLIPEVMNGTHGRFDAVRMGTFRKLTLTSDKPLYIHTDGEIYTSFGSNLHGLSFEIVPNALKVVRGPVDSEQ